VPGRAWAKEAVFPAERFPGADARGPEMRSTGEVMASAPTVAGAYRRALRAAGRTRRGGSVMPPLQVSGRPRGSGGAGPQSPIQACTASAGGA
jgi:hypothetical protein